MTQDSSTQKRGFPALVLRINDSYTVVINRGRRDGVSKGDRFLVYGLSKEELHDPETGENLGRLEIVRGTGVVTHTQEKLSTIETNRRGKQTRKIRDPYRPLGFNVGNVIETIEEEGPLIPFEGLELGDLARPI